MVSKKQLQYDLTYQSEMSGEYRKESVRYRDALLRFADFHGIDLGYFSGYSLEKLIVDLETVANEKTATEARKRLGLDKPKENKTSMVEKELREISDWPLPQGPEHYEDRVPKKEGPMGREWDFSGWAVGPKVKDPGGNYSAFNDELDAMTELVAYLEAFGLGPPIPERAVTHRVPQSYSEGGYTKTLKPRYRLEAIPCTKPQEYRVVPIEEEK